MMQMMMAGAPLVPPGLLFNGPLGLGGGDAAVPGLGGPPPQWGGSRLRQRSGGVQMQAPGRDANHGPPAPPPRRQPVAPPPPQRQERQFK